MKKQALNHGLSGILLSDVCEATALCFCNHGDVLFLYIVHLSELHGCVSSLKTAEREETHGVFVSLQLLSLPNVIQPSCII